MQVDFQQAAPELATSGAAASPGALLAAALRAVRNGNVPLPCCFVENMPFTCMSSGKLAPVRLPCGCTVSSAAAQSAIESGSCPLCGEQTPCDAELAPDYEVVRVLQAGRFGVRTPELERSRLSITAGCGMSQGAQGRYQNGELLVDSGGSKQVAVHVVPLSPEVAPEDLGALRQAVSTVLLASRSQHACKVFGVSWGESDAWCDAMLMQHNHIAAR